MGTASEDVDGIEVEANQRSLKSMVQTTAVPNGKKCNCSGSGEDRLEPESRGTFVGCKLSDDFVQD